MTPSDFSSTFFLGAELTELWISSLDPKLVKVFGSYLDQVEHHGKRYLGKISSDPLTLEQLEQLEAHILSLFLRLGSKEPLPSCTLFPLKHQSVICSQSES